MDLHTQCDVIRLTRLYIILLMFYMVVCQKLHRSQCLYGDMPGKPENSSQILQLKNVPVHAACLVKCDRKEDCDSFLYDGTSGLCTLFNTSTSALPLNVGEKATRRTNQCIKEYGPSHLINCQQVPSSALSCTASTTYTAATTFACSNTMDGDIGTGWTSGQFGLKWILHSLDRIRRITRADIWRNPGQGSQCRTLKVTVGGHTQTIQAPCGQTPPQLFNIFYNARGIATTEIKTECVTQCGSFFGFREIIVREIP